MAETQHRRANGFRIDVPHNLADILFLPAQRTARLDLACFENGLEQVFVKPDLQQV